MRNLRGFLGPLIALLVTAGMAQSGNVALILGDRSISNFSNTWSRGEAAAYSAEFEAAGFEVIEPNSRSIENMLQAASQVDGMMQRGEVERLAIVVLGPIAGNQRDQWVLGAGAGQVTELTIGSAGLSLNALSTLAARAERSVILISPGWREPEVGPGLVPGLSQFDAAGGVTYVVGDAGRMAGFVKNDLLNPQNSLADLVRAAPSDVVVSGFLARSVSFMGDGASRDPVEMLEEGYWAAVRDIDRIDAYEFYLRKFPRGPNRSEARKRIKILKNQPAREAEAAEAALNLTRAERKKIQQNLKLLGYDPHGIDGKFGQDTRGALAAWQRANGFDETGFINDNQLFRIQDQVAELQKEEERKDRAYWRATGQGGSESGLRAYLDRYPDGVYSGIAKARLEEIEEIQREQEAAEERLAWDIALAGDTIGHYRAFLDEFPNGVYATDAKARLAALENPGPTAGEIAQAKAEERRTAGNVVARLLVEQQLRSLGYNSGSIDGKFSARARAAIKQFQIDKGLPETGYISRATMSKLMGN